MSKILTLKDLQEAEQILQDSRKKCDFCEKPSTGILLVFINVTDKQVIMSDPTKIIYYCSEHIEHANNNITRTIPAQANQ